MASEAMVRAGERAIELGGNMADAIDAAIRVQVQALDMGHGFTRISMPSDEADAIARTDYLLRALGVSR